MQCPPVPTLLVVDDEPEVLRSVHDLLRLDYRVLTFDRGAEALELLDAPGPIHVDHVRPADARDDGRRVPPPGQGSPAEATRLLFTGYADIKAVIDAINQGHVFRTSPSPGTPTSCRPSSARRSSSTT